MSRTTSNAAVVVNNDEGVVLLNSDITPETDWSGISTETVEAYQNAQTPKERAVVRKSAETAMLDAIGRMDGIQANYWMRTKAALTVKSDDSDKTPADPADVLNVRIAGLVLAARYVADGTYVPEGLDVASVDYSRFESFSTVLNELAGTFDQSLLDGANDSAEKIASAKITRSSEKHDIGDVVRKAFNGLVSGDSLKLSEVARLGREEDYKPSSGAIAARFIAGKMTGVSGFTYQPTSADSPATITKD